ncbi:MAG: zinc dependent phospholipase C family protein [Longimicrobiales bacterium]
MPNFALHTLLASRVVENWAGDPAAAPFDPADPVSRNAFYHGAVGPDMGMYPGGDHLLSALVHRMRSGQLTRTLIETARSDAERAFAWGWLTHVLADRELHPVVNQIAAASLGWDAPRLQSPSQMGAHVRVEMGLDAEYVARHPFLWEVRLHSATREPLVGLIQVALFDTYGVWFDGAAIVRSHRAVLRFHRHVLLVARHTARTWGAPVPPSPALRVVGAVIGLLQSVTGAVAPPTTVAFLDPDRPTAALRERVDDVIERFPEMVDHHRATKLATLPDYDLETGGIEEPSSPTPSTLEVLRGLSEQGLEVVGRTATEEAA